MDNKIFEIFIPGPGGRLEAKYYKSKKNKIDILNILIKNKKISMYKIWIDEAGRWPWLGPVVACALCLNPENKPSKELLDKINDSKKLSEKKRNEIYKQLIILSGWNKPSIFFWCLSCW